MARNSKGVAVMLDRLLDEADQEYNQILFESMSQAIKKCKKDVQAASPGGGQYRRGWSVRTKRLKYGFQGVIYNKAKPGLTHLLEDSHIIKNEAGSYGRTYPGHGQVKHIGPARDQANDYLIELLMARIENV